MGNADIAQVKPGPNRITPAALQRYRRILGFWHKVEFFIPFDLQRQVIEDKEAEWSVRQISVAALRVLEPVASGELWRVARVPAGKKLTGFDLYLGIFDKSLLTEISQRVVNETLSETERLDEAERGDLEGPTCFARIRLNALGEPLLDEASVSTVPWALGRIQRHGLAGLEFDAFQQALQRLQQELWNFQAGRRRPSGNGDPSPAVDRPALDPSPLPLTRQDLFDLLDIFYRWADFQPPPTEQAVLLIRAKAGKPPKQPPASSAAAEAADTPLATDDDDDEAADPETEIDILNSFYAKDIERALAGLEAGEISPSLAAYLSPLPAAQRLDLYTAPGRERILAELHPARLPRSHWLDEPSRTMSLMQQFAIHNAFGLLDDGGGVFSVNGPPGTGKTTLLREIFAENITRRARALARFSQAGEAFFTEDKPLRVSFEGAENFCQVWPLKPELTGFEMVVASSNNRAVENISHDLPKAKSLGGTKARDGWRLPDGSPRQTYLQPVAHKIAAQKENGEFDALSPDDTPWGLIACALGKRANRLRFAERLNFPSGDSPPPWPKGYDPTKHRSIWAWRKAYVGPSFAQARQAFLQADRRVEERQSALARWADLLTEVKGWTQDSYTQAQTTALAQAEQAVVTAQAEFGALDEELRFYLSQLDDLRAAESLIERRRPGGWRRLLRLPAYRRYRLDLDANHVAQRRQLDLKLTLQPAHRQAAASLKQAQAAAERARRELAERRRQWDAKQARLAELWLQFPQAACPSRLDDLEADLPYADNWQIQGVWRDDTLSRLRSELFAAALDLQQAWLAETLQSGGRFGPTVVALRHLLAGKRLSDPRQAPPLWRSLFMITPVVSTTFASIASQFRDLGPASLGWLFIDEAGQAVPQAAVGALWRARRAVVVGDPLQIEPVFTAPIKLIEALARSSGLAPDEQVEPHRFSAQTLADEANSLGAWIVDQEAKRRWIGSPLRVHRRCVEPMFGLANEIAYAGTMVYGLTRSTPPDNRLDWGGSAWVQLAGSADYRQVVPAQIELALQAVVAHYQTTRRLPPLYIISPFKRIKQALIEALSDLNRWRQLTGVSGKAPGKADLRKWLSDRIGTVHTFQGKEESIVWLVLGCDPRTLGAVAWASAKPNLLNVAATRAQQRLFVIGDLELWGGQQYFDRAKARLPVISSEEFSRRAAGG